MFHDLDASLENVLAAASFPPQLGPVEISFKRPDKTVSFNGATVSLFLYGAKENRALRDPVPMLTFANGVFERKQPPMRVDCDYLVTAWHTGLSLDARVAAEHELLAAAMNQLSHFPVIPDAMLAGDMVDQPFSVPLWVAQEEDGKGLGEFWSSLGIPPCASFHLMATIALLPSPPVAEGPPVTTHAREIDDDLDPTTPGEWLYTFGGRVRDGAGNAVAKAEVTLDAATRVETDAEGKYRFIGVTAGVHAIVVTKDGVTAGGNVTIPPDPTAQPPPTLTDFDFVL